MFILISSARLGSNNNFAKTMNQIKNEWDYRRVFFFFYLENTNEITKYKYIDVFKFIAIKIEKNFWILLNLVFL